MKKSLLFFFIILIGGCATYETDNIESRVGDIIHNPVRGIIEDQTVKHYKMDRDDLESKYLNKEISYDDYLKQKRELDESYQKEIQKQSGITTSIPEQSPFYRPDDY